MSCAYYLTPNEMQETLRRNNTAIVILQVQQELGSWHRCVCRRTLRPRLITTWTRLRCFGFSPFSMTTTLRIFRCRKARSKIEQNEAAAQCSNSTWTWTSPLRYHLDFHPLRMNAINSSSLWRHCPTDPTSNHSITLAFNQFHKRWYYHYRCIRWHRRSRGSILRGPGVS